MCFYPSTKHDENEPRYDIDGEGDSTAEIKEGDEREWGQSFSMRTFCQ